MTSQYSPVPKLSANELESLRESIRKHGIRRPIIVSSGPACKGAIVDGIHRKQLARELRVPCPHVYASFETEAELRLKQIEINAEQRRLTIAQRLELGKAHLRWQKELNRSRRVRGLRRIERKGTNGTNYEATRATAIAANAIGMKRDTFEHGLFVLEQAPREIRSAFIRGELSVDGAYRKTKQYASRLTGDAAAKALKRPTDEIPAGTHDVIVLDPPWQRGRSAFAGGLAELPIDKILARRGVLYLWTTVRSLHDALELLQTWKLNVHRIVTWVKDETTKGGYEYCLVASRSQTLQSARLSNVIQGRPGRGTGRFPKMFLEIVEAMPAAGSRRLSLFAGITQQTWTNWMPSGSSTS